MAVNANNLLINDNQVTYNMKLKLISKHRKYSVKWFISAIFSNYRPVSILPTFSKFLGRIIYNRLLSYLDRFRILCDNQYVFRKNYSTSFALIDLYDKISSAIDRKEISVEILDLS
jgi:hypothetical protein